MFGFKYGFYNSTSLGRARFSPLALFTSGEQGFYYDPSDFSTLYQDNAGTTPVTAVGQTVGLVLDKSRGLVLGPELVANGDFSNGLTGWSSGTSLTATATVVNGAMEVTATSAFGRYLQTFNTVAGRTYAVSAQLRKVSGTGNPYLFVSTTGEGDSFVSPTGSSQFVTVTLIFTATSSTSKVGISPNTSGGVAVADNISVRELPGNHATQSVLASRPILQQDANGKFYLLFDGSDDFLVTNTITPGTDKAQVFAGVRKLSDAAQGSLIELSATVSSNPGAFAVQAPRNVGVGSYTFFSGGTALQSVNPTGFAAPITNVLTGIGDIAADTAILRVNGAQAASSTSDQGTGNYLAYPAYIGRRGGTALPFNGRIYGLIARFGANLSDVQIAQTEQWMNSKTGAY